MTNFKINTIDQTNTKGTFVIEPLDSGFGHTMGNILRRVMLSALEGGAISSVKIQGVAHQFATIPGVTEDAIEILLNLKKVRVKVYSDKPIRVTLQANGKGEVTAKQIDTQGNGEILNPDQHIAFINDPKTKLSIEMTAEKGMGYIGADEKKSNEIGSLPIDSIFSPVLAVNYTVDATRVGRRTDFDKVTMEITTDGTLSPEEALTQSARMLAASFKQVYDPTLDEEVVTVSSSISDDVLKMSVEELDLPVRITNALKAIDIDEVEDLLTTPRATLMKAKNLGAKSLSLISEKLTERGLSLSEA